MNSLDVTIDLPCYNEQDHVLQELERINVAMDRSGYSYELLVIDDKSTDSTSKYCGPRSRGFHECG